MAAETEGYYGRSRKGRRDCRARPLKPLLVIEQETAQECILHWNLSARPKLET